MRPSCTDDYAMLTDEAAFLALEQDWQTLAAAHRYDSVFLGHGWMDAAWQWRREDAELQIVTIRTGHGLIAICPFVRRRRLIHRVPVRSIEFLAVPDTQECDILCDRHHEAEAGALLRRLFASRIRDWDVISLNLLRPDAFALEALSVDQHGRGVSGSSRVVATNPVIPLQGTWQEYYATRSRRLKKGNNLIANRLQRGHRNIEVLRMQPATGERSAGGHCIDRLRSVSRESWKAESTPTTFDRPGPGRFLGRLFERLGGTGELACWFLDLDGVPAASELQLDHAGTISALRSDFRQSLADESPGSYLNWKLLEQLFDSPAELYRMGPGANPYKSRWSVTGEELSRLTIYNSTAAGQSCRLAGELVAPMLRRLRG